MVAVKVQAVKRAAQSKLERCCQRCGQSIESGDSYYYLDHWRIGKAFFCANHYPRPSDMVISPNKQRLYRAQESVHDAIQAWLSGGESSALAAVLEGAVCEARLVVASYLGHASGPYVDPSQAK